MMAAKEAIAEEEDDDVPGKQSVFEISERISCCIVFKWFISPRRTKHWCCLLFPLTDLVENFDEASKNEANWFFIALLAVVFFF